MQLLQCHLQWQARHPARLQSSSIILDSFRRLLRGLHASAGKLILGKAQGNFSSASKRTASSQSKTIQGVLVHRWTRYKSPPTVALPPSTVAISTIGNNSRSTQDDAVPPPDPNELETRLITKPKTTPKPKPEPAPTPAMDSIEEF
jgi:hypothetical protein